MAQRRSIVSTLVRSAYGLLLALSNVNAETPVAHRFGDEHGSSAENQFSIAPTPFHYSPAGKRHCQPVYQRAVEAFAGKTTGQYLHVIKQKLVNIVSLLDNLWWPGW